MSEALARGQADEARVEEATQRGLAEQRRTEAEDSRQSLQSTLADMYTAQGLMAAERDHPDQSVLWFANAAGVAPLDVERSRFNSIRAWTWGRTISLPVAAFNVEGDRRLRNLVFHPREPHLLSVDSSSRCVLWDVMRDEAIPIPGGPGTATSAAWSPDGKVLAIGRRAGEVEVCEYPRAKRIALISHRGPIHAVTFSKDGRYLALASDVVRVWDCQDNRFITPELVHPQPVDLLTFNSRADRIVTTGRDFKVRVFAINRSSGSVQTHFAPVPHYSSFDAPEGGKVIAGQLIAPLYADHDNALITIGLKTNSYIGGTQVLWRDAQTGRVVRVLDEGGAGLFLGSDRHIFLGGSSRRSQLVDSVTGLAAGPALQHTHGILTAAFSADGRRLLTGGEDGITRLWSVPDGRLIDQRGLHGVVSNVALSGDGRFQATATGGLIRVWVNPSGGLERFGMPIEGRVSLAIFSPGGGHVLATGARNRQCIMTSTGVYDVATGRPSGPPLRPGGAILSAAFAPDGATLVLASSQRTDSLAPKRWGEGRVTRWEWRRGRMIGSPTVIPDDPWEVCFSPDGKLIAVTTALSRLILIESATGKVIRDEETGLGPGRVSMWGKLGQARVCFSRDGRRLFTWHGGMVYEWDPATEGGKVAFMQSNGFDLSFSADGCRILQGTRIWDSDTRKLIAELPAHPDQVFASHFSPDGTRVLTGCRDGAARLWEWRSGRLVCPPLHHTHEVWDVGFTPDGKFLTTASLDGTARVWESLTGRPVTPPLSVGVQAWSLAISPEGRWLTVGGFGFHHLGIPVFDLQDLSQDSPMKPDELQRWSELVACQQIHPSGNIENLSDAEWLVRWKAFRHMRNEQPSLDWSSGSQAEWHDRIALVFESAGDGQAEIWHLDRLLELRPRSPHVLRRRGRVLLGLGQREKAVMDLSAAIDLDPADEQAWGLRGAAMLQSGRPDAAITDLTRALDLAPEDRAALINRGIARGSKGGTQAAVEDLSQALCIFPENLLALNARAQLYQSLGLGKQALADFEHRIEIDPDQSVANNNLAWFLATSCDASLRDPKRAVALARKAVELSPKEGTHWNTLGIAHYRAGDWKAAIEALTRSMDLGKGGDPNDWLFLAMAHWRLGDKAQALSWYEKAAFWLDKNQPKNEELVRFRAEAAELLGVKAKRK